MINKVRLKTIARKYGVKIKYVKTNFDAFYTHHNKTVSINRKFKNSLNEELIPIIFHELGHKYCYDNNKFYGYHNETTNKIVRLTGLRAERYVDRWAAKEMLKNGFEIEYPFYYSGKEMGNTLKKYLNENYK